MDSVRRVVEAMERISAAECVSAAAAGRAPAVSAADRASADEAAVMPSAPRKRRVGRRRRIVLTTHDPSDREGHHADDGTARRALFASPVAGGASAGSGQKSGKGKDKGTDKGKGRGTGRDRDIDDRTLVLVAADHAAEALPHFADAAAYETVEVTTADLAPGPLPKGAGDAALLWQLFARLARGELRDRAVIVASRSNAVCAAVHVLPLLEGVADAGPPASVTMFD